MGFDLSLSDYMVFAVIAIPCPWETKLVDEKMGHQGAGGRSLMPQK
jgi:hypothetical protein